MTMPTQTNEPRRAGQFPPGVSGYPHGRESKARRTARREKLIERWLAPHGGVGAVSPAELDLLHQAAELQLRNIRAARAEDAVRICNAIAKVMAMVGLVGRDGQPAAALVEPQPEPEPEETASDYLMRQVADAMSKKDGDK
jgi:hypothetical protein